MFEFSIEHLYLFNSWPQVNVNDCAKPFTELFATILYKKYIFILNTIIQYNTLYTYIIRFSTCNISIIQLHDSYLFINTFASKRF